MTRQEAIKLLCVEKSIIIEVDGNKGAEKMLQAYDMAIEALSADRPTGKWVNRERCQVDEDAYEVATCSKCGAEITIEYPHDNYCPSCGAKMEGGEEE